MKKIFLALRFPAVPEGVFNLSGILISMDDLSALILLKGLQ